MCKRMARVSTRVGGHMGRIHSFVDSIWMRCACPVELINPDSFFLSELLYVNRSGPEPRLYATIHNQSFRDANKHIRNLISLFWNICTCSSGGNSLKTQISLHNNTKRETRNRNFVVTMTHRFLFLFGRPTYHSTHAHTARERGQASKQTNRSLLVTNC